MVPPAFTEVRQDVLHRKFDHLVEDLPEVQDPHVADDKRGQEPVAQVHNVVVIEVVKNVLPFQLTVVIVGVHLCGDWLVQVAVEVAKEGTTLLWAQVEHEYEPGHIHDSQGDDETIQALPDGSKTVFRVRLQVGESQYKDDD